MVMTPKRPNSILLSEAVVPEISECPNTVSAHEQFCLISSCLTDMDWLNQESFYVEFACSLTDTKWVQ